MKTFEVLHSHIRKLDELLSNPEYGVNSWGAAVSEHWSAIVELWDLIKRHSGKD